MPTKIRGWPELERVCGKSKQMIRRYMAFNEFPKPTKVKGASEANPNVWVCVWLRSEVIKWIYTHEKSWQKK